MKRFFGIFLSDGYKLAKMKSLYIGIAVMAVLVLVSALAVTGMAELYEEAYGENMIFGDGNGGIKEVDDVAAEIMLQDGLSMLATAPASSAVTTLVAIIAALFIGTDYSSGMMRLFVGRGAGKAQAFVSKWLWVLILTLVYTCVSYLFCLIAAAALGADGNAQIGISRGNRVLKYVLKHDGSFFRQLAIVSAGTRCDHQFILKGKVTRCVYARDERGRLYFVETAYPETLYGFADALVEDGFIDAVYVTGGAQPDLFYRETDGTAHGGYVDDKPHKLVVWTGK